MTSFWYTWPRWYSTVLLLMNSLAAISRLVSPRPTSREMSRSRPVSPDSAAPAEWGRAAGQSAKSSR